MATLGTGLTPANHYAQLNRMRIRVYDITDYQAVGNNSTDNTTYIQAAVEAAHAAGGGDVLVPGGIFLTHTITSYSDVRFVGIGYLKSILRSIAAEVLISCIETTYTSIVGYKDIKLDGNNIGTIGFSSAMHADFKYEGVYVRDFTVKGIYLYKCLIGQFDRCIFRNCVIGVDLVGRLSNAVNLIAFNGCEFYYNTSWAIHLFEGLVLVIDAASDFELNGTNGNINTGCIYFSGGQGTPGSNMGLIVRDSWMEANNGTLIHIDEPYLNHKNLSLIESCQLDYNTNPVLITVTGVTTENKLVVSKSASDVTCNFVVNGANAKLVNDCANIDGTITKTNSGISYTVTVTQDQ